MQGVQPLIQSVVIGSFAPDPKPPPIPADTTHGGRQYSGHEYYWSFPEANVTTRPRKGIPIGELLVKQGVLTERQVRHILTVQKSAPRPFGDLAERLYGVSARVIEDAWVVQYVHSAETCDLEELDFDEQCLRMLNRRQAWQFHALPVNREDSMLQIATDVDHVARAVNFANARIDEPIHMLIAERGQLRDFLMKHYPVPEAMASYAERM